MAFSLMASAFYRGHRDLSVFFSAPFIPKSPPCVGANEWPVEPRAPVSAEPPPNLRGCCRSRAKPDKEEKILDSGVIILPLARYDRPNVDTFRAYPPAEPPLGGGGTYGESEVHLLRRIAGGDQGALERLYQIYAGRILAFLRQLSRNTEVAEDLVQDVFLAVWRKAATYDAGRGDVAGWLFTICRHKFIDSKRRHHPTVELDAMEYDPPAPSSTRELRLALEQAMGILSENEREALSLAYFGGLTYEETAEQLALPLGTLKSRIRAGLKKIAHHIGEPA